jgi:hypothetical protein
VPSFVPRGQTDAQNRLDEANSRFSQFCKRTGVYYPVSDNKKIEISQK